VDILLDQSTGSTATATVTGISPVGTGIHLVDASYAGNSSYSGSISGTTPLVAERVATTLTVTASSTVSSGVGQVLLTATLNPSLAQNHAPTGEITFYNGNTNLGTGEVSSGVATLNAATLPFGSDSITAVYPGDTNFIGSTSPVLALTLDFTISASPSSQTLYTGQDASYAVTITPSSDFNLPVALSCSQLPANTTCNFSAASVNGGSWSSTLVVQTTAPSPAATVSISSTKLRITALAGLLILFIPRRLRRRNGWPVILMILAAFIVSATIAGCAAPGPLTGGTPAGAQSVTVTGTATNGPQTLTHATTVTLNVKSLF
jgi:hypothetical protein